MVRTMLTDAVPLPPPRRLWALLGAAAVIWFQFGCPAGENPAENQPQPDAGQADVDDTTDTGADANGTDDGEPMIPGLEGSVTVHRDDAGVLHIECEHTRDCFVAQGYFHAQDRFFQMDMMRNQVRGQLSRAVGFQFGLDSDVYWRHLMTTPEGQPLEEAYLEALSDETRDILQAYSDGVNSWLNDLRDGEHDARLPEEFDFPLLYDAEDIREWEPKDSVSTYLQFSFQFAGLGQQMRFGELASQLDPEVFADALSPRPGVESSIVEASEQAMLTAGDTDEPAGAGEHLPDVHDRLAAASDLLAETSQRIDANSSLVFGAPTPGDGSNNWVVAPERTAGGETFMVNDPHLTLMNPPIWHFNRLESTDDDSPLHVAGAAIPASPGVAVGHNEHVAWGVTVAYYDLLDVYVDELTDDADAIDHEEGPIDLHRETFEFRDRHGDVEQRTLHWVPDRGPVIAMDPDAGRAISVRWVGHQPGDDVDYLPALLSAESMDQARDALERIRVMNMNWVVADDGGNIGWFPEAKVPERRGWVSPEMPSFIPVPGDGSADWDGFVDDSEIPRLENPPAGYIATANNDFDGRLADGDPTAHGAAMLQSNTAPGHRHRRIVERLEASTDHDVDSMHDIVGDTHSVQGEQMVPVITGEVDDPQQLSPRAASVYSALEDWQFGCPSGLDGLDPRNAAAEAGDDVVAEAVGCTAFHVLSMHLTDRIFGPQLEAYDDTWARDNWTLLQDTLLDLVERPEVMAYGERFFEDASGEPEDFGEIVIDALHDTGEWLEDQFDSNDSDDWLWGRIHAANFTSVLPAAGEYDEGPAATPGGWQTVNVADPVGGDASSSSFEHNSGVSFRMVVEIGDDAVHSQFQLPGGQVHHRDSPFYHNLVENWVYNESTPIPFSSHEAAERAVETF